jgi:hypothetical protein
VFVSGTRCARGDVYVDAGQVQKRSHQADSIHEE